MRKLILVLAAMFVLAGGQTASASTAAHMHPALRDAIKPFAPRTSQVYCSEDMLDYGETFPFSGEIYLNQYLCNPLEQLLNREVSKPKRQGAGIITLTHEAIHVRVWYSEARTECLAFQTVDNVLRLWKEPKWVQMAVLPWAYHDHYLLIDTDHLYRNDSKCRADGAWDVTPGDGRWP